MPIPLETGGALEDPRTTRHNAIVSSSVDPVDVQVQSLCVSLQTSSRLDVRTILRRRRPRKQSWKQIIGKVSASLPPNSFTAILGSSGSGKTTMLSAIAERLNGSKVKIEGSVTFNGVQGVQAIRSAYVTQQDVLIPTLTIRETLQYAADLRLPYTITRERRDQIVENVILELGLRECADTQIGTSQRKGCSSGEIRRTSIGVQLLSNPSVLFLDEPTTGLDATSACQLARTLKALTARGRTVLATIHQPRSEIWSMLDQVILLTKGSTIYSGNVQGCLSWFRTLGIEPPGFVNPAEFLVDLATVDMRSPELEATSTLRVAKLETAWHTEDCQRHTPAVVENLTPALCLLGPNQSCSNSTFIGQTRVLATRTFRQTYRDPIGMVSLLLEAIFMGLLNGWMFLDLGRDLAGIRSREGALYASSALQGYILLLYETYRLSLDIQVFDREYTEHVVDVLPFLLSRRLARFLPEDLPIPLLYSAIFYFMAGFRKDLPTFLTFFLINWINHYACVSFAMLCVAISRSFTGASLIANLGYTVQSLSCGFFIQSHQMPIFVRWLKWIAYCFYAFGALCANEFIGQFYDCPYGEEQNPVCAQYTGTYIMKSLGFPEDWIIRPLLVIFAFAIFFYLWAGICLRVKKVNITVSKARTSVTDLSVGKEQLVDGCITEPRALDIKLLEFGLKLDKRVWFKYKGLSRTLLHPINADFQHGTLNIILGPSGSGKTSLLNSIAMRLDTSLDIRYTVSGTILVNGALPSTAVIRSNFSYVCQDEDALLPSLTVRETLRFAARLRLPLSMTTWQKIQRAEDIILKMGLKDCADTIIGSELIHGISGGEKRRVGIAIQILMNPRVLLLDEPTSGLDAFTASSIVDVLRGLAREGRTVILSIHQPRAEMYKHFGNIILLARGGTPVYSGSGLGMLPYFKSLGYVCPRTMNPTDFALDLITVDLQQADREAITRSKVRHLISCWSAADNRSIPQRSVISMPAEIGSLLRQRASFTTAYPILVHRAFINLRRQPFLIAARTVQVLGLTVIMILFFSPLKNNFEAIQTRVGLVQQICSFYFVGLLQNVSIYPAEKAIFDREHDDVVYGVTAFFLQYLTLEVPFEICTSCLFAILLDFSLELPRNAHMISALFFNCFCIVSCGESMGIIFNSLFTHKGVVVSLASVFLCVGQIVTGILSIDMPLFFRAISYLSPLRYAVRILCPLSLRQLVFTCTDGQVLAGGSCVINSGKDVLELYRMGDSPGLNTLALGLSTLCYRALAWVFLRFVRVRQT